MRRILFVAAIAAFIPFGALAQVSNGRVTTVAPTYSNGTAAPLSLTTGGALRTSSTPSGTQDVNISQILGAAPSATNPLWVSPATASNPWPISAASLPLPSGAATSALQSTINTTLGSPFQAGGSIGNTAFGATQSGTWNVGSTSAYPNGATAETASATGTTTATAATLATGVGKTTYICGFSIRANATAAATGNSTVAGTITGTLNFTQWTAPLASGLGITEMIFTPCVPASATNTTIVVTSAAPGAGGTVSVSAWGYQQ